MTEWFELERVYTTTYARKTFKHNQHYWSLEWLTPFLFKNSFNIFLFSLVLANKKNLFLLLLLVILPIQSLPFQRCFESHQRPHESRFSGIVLSNRTNLNNWYAEGLTSNVHISMGLIHAFQWQRMRISNNGISHYNLSLRANDKRISRIHLILSWIVIWNRWSRSRSRLSR